ncbi:DNA repair protein rhp42 [Pseudocercospora fuligena]|uniref:DNA repair protein rhp42 n=1 Tax=Pseudocercospora fuligena TaxID=685502 RepID=A0A8H6RLS3_9PEZI|nr:DNA repair protein rhp42 [Pseudocercospora fuligena]
MPPFISRKREHSPIASPPAKRKAPAKPTSKKGKQTLFEAADEPRKKAKSVEETKKALNATFGDDDHDESISDVDSDEFEDVPPSKRQKMESDNDDDADEMDWEDAIDNNASTVAQPGPSKHDTEIGDIDVSLNEDNVYIEPEISLATGKKGPTKRERQVRVISHCLHVQSLMWHNTVRNSWLNDKEVQKSLVDGLTDGVKKEVTRWREAMGTLSKEELQARKQAAAKAKGRRGGRGKGKSSGRDWNYDAQHLEQGVPNLSQGDPLLRLLKVLTAYWRKRFIVTAPAIRKLGFMPLRRLRDEIKHWDKNRNDAEEHGERIEDITAFRELAKRCEGSRDVGGQLFVALLRGIGLETRMVANLQPSGIGWSKGEEANEKRSKKDAKPQKEEPDSDDETVGSSSKTNGASASKSASKKGKSNGTTTSKQGKSSLPNEKPTRKSSRGNKGDPINLEDSDSPLSEPPSENEKHDPDVVAEDDIDDVSVIDVTPATPRRKPSKKYDRDLAFPTYWTEVCSPVSHKWIPVDPIVLSTIASNDELLQSFEPRGKKAENAKQVICYVLGFAADGTAKDVTIRYLKRHQLPGKTKGMRMPAEKIPIYNKRGKVKRYEDYDWFKTVMSIYDRPQIKRTAADDLEEQTDLKPFKPAKEEKEVAKESLQWYKQSADYVLEQHLRREEAILPHAKPVKMFTAGKGDKATEHPVFRRSDVVTCKTVESWHKEGRAVKTGEQPMKHVPVRAVTLIRKREMEEHFKENGEKLQQGLYSWNQTDWIIPRPIENGVIPKNAFGNMDVYVETMVPQGAVHLPLKGSAKICRKLEIDYAEACTGFEFGKQRAVPILTGVVVAEEHEILVRDAWREAQAEIKRKEDTKRTATALHWWRKMVMSMRIIERMRVEYEQADDGTGEINPFISKAQREGKSTTEMNIDEDAGAGGFFQPGHDEEEVVQHKTKAAAEDVDLGGGFFADSEDEPVHDEGGDGGFLVEDEAEPGAVKPGANHPAPITPVSLEPVAKAQANEESEDDKPLPVKRTSAKKSTSQTKKPTSKANGRATPKRKPPAPKASSDKDEDEDSPLTDVSEAAFAAGDDEDEIAASQANRRRSSPQVLISPPKRAAPGRRTSGRTAKKATPVRSQYFNAVDDDHEDDEDDLDEDMSEEEVVKPTRTTARTRAKR